MGFRRRGDKAPDIDQLFVELSSIRQTVADQGDQMDQMQQSALIGAAIPANPLVVSRRTKSRGEFVTLGFFIDKSCTSVKCFLIAAPDNKDLTGGSVDAMDLRAARAKILEFEWDDISDDERTAGFIAREFGIPLAFSTRYGITRTVAKNDATGLVATIKNPDSNPYGSLPFPFIKRSNDGITLTTDACFTTANSDGVGGTDECGGAEVGSVVPRPHPTAYVKSQKVTQRGVKVKLQVIVPRTAKTVRVRLIKTDEITGGQNPDFTASISYRWDVTPGDLTAPDFANPEPDARIFTGDFGEKLDFGAQYQTIRIVVEGEGVGGNDLDIIKNPTTGAASIANGTFTAGASTTGTNAALRLDSPWVDQSLDPSNNNLPKGFKLKKSGVKALMNFLIPPQTLSLKCRIKARNDMNALTLSDEWDDITDAERTAVNATQGKATRMFSPLLDFNTTYDLIRLIGEGDNIGGDAVDVAKVGPTSTPAVTGSFTTPNSDGTFTPTGAGALSFIGVTGRRAKKNGVIVKLRYEVPTGTKKLTVRLQNIRDAGDSKAILTHTFEDIVTSAGAPGGGLFFEEDFPEKLDAGTATAPETYGVVRLIAEGPNINADFQDSSDIDIVRNPKTQPAAGVYIATFTTASIISFGSAIVPSVPRSSDLSNTLEQDAPKVLWDMFASEFRAATAQGGSAAGGAINFNDINATEAFVIAKRDTDAATAEPIKKGGPISDPSQISTRIEIDGLVFGKNYQIIRNIVTAGADRAVQAAPIAITFRAGGSITLTDLLLIPSTGERFSITELLKISSNETLVRVQYNEPTSTVLIRKIKISKRVQGKFTDFREQAEIVLRDDQSNFTPGLHTFDFTISHPPSAIIDVQASLIALAGGSPAQLDDFAFNVATDALSGLTDPGRPQFSGRRTDGGINSSPFKQPDMKVRWRGTGIKVRLNKPDVNMVSFDRNILFFVFSGSRIVGGLIDQFFYYYNPNSDAVSQRFTVDPFLDPNNSTFGVELGQAAGDFFPVVRPNAADAGELPAAIYNELRDFAATPGGSTSFIVRYFVLNRTTAPISPPGTLFVPNNGLLVTSQAQSFPFGGLSIEASVV